MVLFAHHAEVIPAHAVVHGDALGGLPGILEVGAAVVLVGVARATAGRRTAAVNGARQEVVQRVEAQLAAVAAVNKAVDERAPPLVPGLVVVLALGQADVAEELVVGVNAAARVTARRADRAVAAHVDGRQAGVVRQVSLRLQRRVRQRVQPDRSRIEGAILRQEVLQEAVVAAADLDDEVVARHRGVAQRKDVDVRRRVGIEARRAAARGQHAQREALRAAAEEVAAGQKVSGAEQFQVLVHFHNQVVAVVAEGGAEGLIAVAAGRQCAPGIARQQALDHRVDAAHRRVGRNVCLGGHLAQLRQSALFTLALVGRVKEALVLVDGPAQAAPKLMIGEAVLRVGRGVEEVARTQCGVAEVFKCRPVQYVGAALGHDVDRGARAASEFGLRAAGHGNFGQRIHRKNRRRAAPDARLVDGGQVAVAVVHVRAVQQVVVAAAAVAVQAEQSVAAGRLGRAHRIARGAGHQFEQLGEVASIHRQFAGLAGADGAARGVAGRLHHGNVGHHFHRFFHLAGLQMGVGARRRSHAYRNLGQRCLAEAFLLNRQVVGAQRKFAGHVLACRIGQDVAAQARLRVADFDFGSGHSGTAGVGHSALNAAAEGLAHGATGK